METQSQIYTDNSVNEEEQAFSIKDFLRSCLHNWRWFVIAIIVCFGIGAWYVLRQQPVYTRTMSLLIKDQRDAGSTGDITASFSSLGLLTSSTGVQNELIQFQSPALMSEVVTRLDLQTSYAAPGLFHDNTLYGTKLPYEVIFQDLKPTQSAGLTIVVKNGKVLLCDFIKYENGDKQELAYEVTVVPGMTPVKTPLGNVVVRPNAKYVPAAGAKAKAVNEILVNRSDFQSTTERYSGELTCALHDRDAEVIDLTINDVSTERATDILNSIVEVYNENWVEDKNQIAVATTHFITERLGVIESELGTVDSDISSFKAAHLTPDLEETARLAMDRNAKADDDLLQLESQLQVAKYVGDYVSNPAYTNQVIPVITGLGDSQLEQQIALYNNLLLERNHMVGNSSETSPMVVDYDRTLASRREAIIKGVRQQVHNLQTVVANTQREQRRQTSTIAEAPSQAQYLISVERQQKVKESLYLFLFQKLEENELSQAFTAYNTRIITPPTGSSAPIAPRKAIIMLISLLLGFLIPAAIIFIRQTLDTRVRSRKDTEELRVPYAGELPYVDPYENKFKKMLGIRKKASEGQAKVVVADGERDIVNEAFRVVRSNIDFMVQNHENGAPVIVVTSFKPSSGKTFVGVNLAAVFALKGKKVLLIDGDMRHASVSSIVNSPRRGLSGYLSGSLTDWRPELVKLPNSTVDVLPVGTIPPNPSELLESDRLTEMLKEARSEYDIIFIDCPPHNVVVDTQIISRAADFTIFIVRCGLFEKRDLPELNEIYDSKKLNRMCYVLNGTEYAGSRYHYYGSNYYSSYYTKK